MQTSQLKQIPFLTGVAAGDLEPWAAAAHLVDEIPQRGVWEPTAEQRGDLFLMARGLVLCTIASRTGESRVTGVIGPQGCVNIQCLYRHPLPAEKVLALADAELVRVPGAVVRASLRAGGSLAGLLGGYAAARLVELADDMIRATTMDVRTRAASWLLRLSDRLNSVMIPVSQEQLSSVVGTRRETLALILGVLRDDDIIDTRYRMIKIYDRERLKAIAREGYPVSVAADLPQPLTGASCLK